MKLLLILLTNLLTRIHIVEGDGCWVSMVCDGKPNWRKITPCDYEMQAEAIKNQCTTELQAIKDQTDSILNEVDDINERMKLLNSRTAPETTIDGVATTDVTSTIFDETTLEDATQTTNMDTTVNELEATTQTTIVETTALHAECSGMVYDGKYYWVEVHSSKDTNFTEAQLICNNENSELADIYSKDHYDQIMNYLRKHLIDGSYVLVWTGMRKKFQNENAFLSNGSQAPYTKPSSYPWAWDEADGSKTHVSIYARASLTDPGQGMAGYRPTLTINGALCQTQ